LIRLEDVYFYKVNTFFRFMNSAKVKDFLGARGVYLSLPFSSSAILIDASPDPEDPMVVADYILKGITGVSNKKVGLFMPSRGIDPSKKYRSEEDLLVFLNDHALKNFPIFADAYCITSAVHNLVSIDEPIDDSSQTTYRQLCGDFYRPIKLKVNLGSVLIRDFSESMVRPIGQSREYAVREGDIIFRAEGIAEHKSGVTHQSSLEDYASLSLWAKGKDPRIRL